MDKKESNPPVHTVLELLPYLNPHQLKIVAAAVKDRLVDLQIKPDGTPELALVFNAEGLLTEEAVIDFFCQVYPDRPSSYARQRARTIWGILSRLLNRSIAIRQEPIVVFDLIAELEKVIVTDLRRVGPRTERELALLRKEIERVFYT